MCCKKTIETIETFVIPLEFRTTLEENQTDFVLHRACIPNPGHGNRLEGYIVLGDEHVLENLFNSTVVATDGTFSIAPPPFTQLTTFVFYFTNIRHNIMLFLSSVRLCINN
jgi:hypothetical protein